MTHSPLPWKAFTENRYSNMRLILDANGAEIVQTDNDGCESDPCPDYIFMSCEDADLIVAAVNGREKLAADLAAVTKQRDELLTACEALSVKWRQYAAGPDASSPEANSVENCAGELEAALADIAGKIRDVGR